MEITCFVYISKIPFDKAKQGKHEYRLLLLGITIIDYCFHFSCFIEIYIHLIDDRESSERIRIPKQRREVKSNDRDLGRRRCFLSLSSYIIYVE